MISCSPKKTEPAKTETNLKGASAIEKPDAINPSESEDGNSGFKNQDESFVKVSGEGENIETEIYNVTYSKNYLNYQNELENYIVKTGQLTKSIRGQEGQNSSITVEIYNIPDSKKISTIEANADDISIFTDFYKTVKYGCCGAESYSELATLWENKTFLKYNSKYYYIEIPNARINFYLGFLVDSRDEGNLILGELYFAQSMPKSVAGKNIISHDFRTVNKVIFKVRNKELFDRIVPFCPEMTLVKNNEEDQLIDYQDHQELRLWSYNNWKVLNGINITGVKLEFSNDTIIPISIPIENGYLFGIQNGVDKIVYVEE